MSLSPGTRLGPYEITELIGAGGMGEVYSAADTNLRRAVAIKVLPAAMGENGDRLARFQREAEVLASLNHPHIAAIYGLERSGATTALVMELVEGPTLADRIAQGAIPLSEARSIAVQIATALEAAHEQRIVHRDLKPANIKVRPDGTVKVLDFGLAKATDPASRHVTSSPGATSAPSMMATVTSPALVTGAGMILGTAAYMSPEQARGMDVDKRADIWALGAVLFEMLTGTRAFAGDTVSDVVASVLAREPDWARLPPALPPALLVYMKRCLHKDPKQRVHDAGDVRLALEGAFDHPKESGNVVAGAPAWSSGLAWTLAGIAAVTAVALGVAYVRQAPSQAPVVVTMIPPPENATFDFDLTVAPAVISPDGRMVAFGARSADGVSQLWVRPLASADARPLDGTAGASFPFWSPDSRSVGFYSTARGRLERISVAGGASVAIARAGFVRGAHWGLDDTIVFDGNGGISAVSAGGMVKRLKTIDAAPGDARAPWLLPDNIHFLYFLKTRNQIRVGSLDGSADALVTEATSSGIFVRDHLLFMREGTLLAQPFDMTHRVLTGEAVAVAGGVQMLVGEPRGVFSASNDGSLLYQGGGTEPATSLAWFDREGKGRTVLGEMGNARGVTLSPDNRSAVVQITDAEQHRDLWRVDTATGRRSRLTFETDSASLSAFTAWSPDGRFVVNAAKRGDKVVLVRRLASGSGTEEVLLEVPPTLTDTGLPRVSDWSRDPGLLVYSGQARGGIWGLPMGLSGQPSSPPRAIVQDPANALNGRISPNGKWISYQAGIVNTTVEAVYVEAFPDGGQRQTVSENGTLAVWSADGAALYYSSDNVLYRVDVSESEGTLRLDTPRALMPIIQGRGFSYDVAKDGRILALVTSERRASRPLTLIQNWIASHGAD